VRGPRRNRRRDDRYHFDGYAIGGLAVGEGQEAMFGVLDYLPDLLPTDRPRYLMGVGRPQDIIGAVVRGVDMFDCVLPTRAGRTGLAFTRWGELNMRNARHADDKGPIDAACACPACRSYARGYLHHLFKPRSPGRHAVDLAQPHRIRVMAILRLDRGGRDPGTGAPAAPAERRHCQNEAIPGSVAGRKIYKGLIQLGARSGLPATPGKAVLERVANPHKGTVYVVRFTQPEFTSLCPITGQPDFAHLVIDYIPDAWLVDSKSLKLYLASFRNHGAFHEACTLDIAKKIRSRLRPRWLRIGGYWYPRGGMPIDVFYETGRAPKGIWIPPQEVAPYRGRG
jgi:7-cyano-7-deazaguanine reductase